MPNSFPHYLKIERHGESPLGVLSVATPPFEVKRVYWISEVGDWRHWNVRRGGHAHQRCEQVFYCLAGRVEITCDNGRGRVLTRMIEQGSPEALYVPAMSWHTMWYLKGSIVLAAASEPYDEREYVRSRQEFEMLVAKKGAEESLPRAYPTKTLVDRIVGA